MAPRKSGRDKPNRDRDVHNPLYHEAEERVLAWLLAQGKEVTDVREERTYYDFIIGGAWTLDVKADTRAHDTGRVVWEAAVIVKGREDASAVQEGWGQHHGLSYIAYVIIPSGYEGTSPHPWPLLIVQAQGLRQAILQTISEGLVGHGGHALRPFVIDGEDRVATGYAVLISWLRDKGLLLEEGEV